MTDYRLLPEQTRFAVMTSMMSGTTDKLSWEENKKIKNAVLYIRTSWVILDTASAVVHFDTLQR